MKTIKPTKRIIADYQRPAYERLLQIVETAKALQQYDLPISPRTNTMIVGPTGTGKTQLVRSVAEESGAKFMAISVLEWIPLGSSGKGSQITWVQIANFVQTECAISKQPSEADEPFVIIFLDECDKLSAPDSTWQSYIATEAYKLLDHQIFSGIKDDADNDFSEFDKARIQYILAHRTMIIGAGAFQSIWDDVPRPAVGFRYTATQMEEVGLSTLAATIPRELSNRFRSELIKLPDLVETDYVNIVTQVAADLPEHLKGPFLRLGLRGTTDAVRQKRGFRYVEEILLEAIMSAQKKNDAPKKIVWKRHPPDSPSLRIQYSDRLDTPEAF